MILTSSAQTLTLNAGPVIYLAKLDALDVLDGYAQAVIASSVEAEVIRPQAAYRFPEIGRIEAAIGFGTLRVVGLTDAAIAFSDELRQRVPGLGVGERDTIALAKSVGSLAVLFDRAARRLAQAMGVATFDVPTLLVEGTRGRDLLERRLRDFANLVNMRPDDLERLLTGVTR